MYSAFRRWIFLQSPAGKKFGRNITSSNPSIIPHAVKERFFHLGGSNSWRTRTSEKLIAWVAGEDTHAETTAFITKLAPDGPVIGDQCFAAAQILAALGLFEASLTYEQRGIRYLHRGHLNTRNPSHLLRRLQSAIHRGDKKDAREALADFRENITATETLAISILDLLHYVDLWTGRNTDEFCNHIALENPKWSDYIDSKDIVVYGPGTIDPTMPAISQSEIVARIAGPGSFSWTSNTDLANGRADIVYVIPSTLESLARTPQELADKVGHFDFLCIKRGEASYLRNSRKVEAGSRLFLRGHPNMVPLAVIDLLRVPGTKVRVIGSDFFASSSSYRPDSIRTTPDGRPQTNQGSTGNSYDRCTLMASHNAFQNRRLVKNLVDSGSVSGDKAFLEACSLSDLDYARRLDLHYGQNRL
jgi:hypothetical protein